MKPDSPKPIAVTIPIARKISGLGNKTVSKLIERLLSPTAG
jgi:hypothetical protein